ncbi:MAG: hypothetical protein Q8O56_12910 [Solirubrobacteraceae bacterium]|nr:hypothetical protein [Solirubrobacteraceae bacterium]
MVPGSPWRFLALAASLVALLAVPASARAQTPLPTSGCDVGPATNFLAADATQAGVVSLVFFGARGAVVEFFECVDGRLVALGRLAGDPDAGTLMQDATTWDCARPTRSFVARATLPDGRRVAGAYSVRTGSCASRFEVRVPQRVARGKVGRVQIVDSWGVGDIKPVLCVSPPRGDRICSTVGFRKAVSTRTRRFRATTTGRWRVELRVGSHRIRRTATVGGGKAPKAPPLVLTTGDSTMQGVDSFLADELGNAATVRSDIRVGTGISKSDWLAIARAQVRRHKQKVTVMSVGVNEGFAMTTPAGAKLECCDGAWLTEYVRRLGAMIDSYRRGGDGRVIWLTLPLPRGGPLMPIVSAVNAAIVRAGRGRRGVAVLRMDQLFSPDGFTEVIRYRGRYVRVRAADGIHLSVSGTAIAARVIAAELRKR